MVRVILFLKVRIELQAAINKSIEIVSGLRSFLNIEEGQDLASNLSDLYEYIEHRLFEANVKNDIDMLNEVASHLRKVKEGWDGIREEALEQGIV